MNEKQILDYLKGTLSQQDQQKVIDWIRSSSDNQKQFNLLKATYVGSSFKEVSDNESDFSYKEFNKKVHVKKNYKYISIAAAFVLVSFVAINFFTENIGFLPHKKSLADTDIINTVTSKGGKSSIVLPDGSKIILNADSKLSYPKEFCDSLRQVTLIGEAFFDIERDEKKPFIVNTNKLKIKVLGTTFNIKSYSKDEKIETTLVTGKVELIKENETPVELAPSQKAVFYKTKNKLQIEEVNSSNIIAWKEGKLVFNNTSMKEVVLDLERKYNTKFIINSQKLLDYEYTGTFDNLTINEVLDLLVISSPIKYSIQDEKVTLEMN